MLRRALIELKGKGMSECLDFIGKELKGGPFSICRSWI